MKMVDIVIKSDLTRTLVKDYTSSCIIEINKLEHWFDKLQIKLNPLSKEQRLNTL